MWVLRWLKHTLSFARTTQAIQILWVKPSPKPRFMGAGSRCTKLAVRADHVSIEQKPLQRILPETSVGTPNFLRSTPALLFTAVISCLMEAAKRGP